MEEQRVLAFTLATIIESEELDHIFGGIGPIVIPTVRVTGGPMFPDTTSDSHSV